MKLFKHLQIINPISFISAYIHKDSTQFLEYFFISFIILKFVDKLSVAISLYYKQIIASRNLELYLQKQSLINNYQSLALFYPRYMSNHHPQLKQFTLQSQRTSSNIIYQNENQSLNQIRIFNNLSKYNNPFQQIDTLNLLYVQNSIKTQCSQNHSFYVNSQPKLNQFQLLKLSLKQWRERRAPNTNEIISVRLENSQVKNFRKNARKHTINKKIKQKQQYNRQNSDTDDLGNDSPYQTKGQLFKKLKNSQKVIKKLQTNRFQTKFRESTNSHLKKEKKFQQEMQKYIIQQRYFFDNGKYRYESQEITKSILQAVQTCRKFQQYAVRTIQIPEQTQFNRSKNPNQYEKAVNQKISKLFPRTFNLNINFF